MKMRHVLLEVDAGGTSSIQSKNPPDLLFAQYDKLVATSKRFDNLFNTLNNEARRILGMNVSMSWRWS